MEAARSSGVVAGDLLTLTECVVLGNVPVLGAVSLGLQDRWKQPPSDLVRSSQLR